MRVLVAAALLLSALFSGCTSSTSNGDDGENDLGLSAAQPVLFLNVTIGNETYQFSSLGGQAGPSDDANANASATAGNATTGGNATGNATGNTTGNTTGNATGNATGNSTGNATGDDASGMGGAAPLLVSVEIGATGLPANGTVSWTLDFGEPAGAAATGNSTGNQTGNSTGNATGNSTGNATGNATGTGMANGTTLPASAEHTYTVAGAHNITLTLRIGNATTPQTLQAMVVVSGDDEELEATAGPVPEPIVITGSAIGIGGMVGNVDETFELTAAVALMTITLEFNEIACAEACVNDLDWSIAGPGGESDGGASFGPEAPVEFENPSLGTWTVTIEPFNTTGPVSYTITVTFA